MKIFFCIFLFLMSSPCELISQHPSDKITTFILVRHAEKLDDSQNPDLSEEGYKRADVLTEMLSEETFDAVYSTAVIRTTETIRKIAEKNNIAISEYDHSKADSLAEEWKEIHKGKNVLISGHSNTTPEFANALLKYKHFSDKFDETDYGNILIVTISADGESNLIHLRY